MAATSMQRIRELLRDHPSPAIKDGYIQFVPDDQALWIPCTQLTDYKSRRGAGDWYTADSIVFLAIHGDIPFRDYAEKCRTAGVSRVQVIDRDEILSYVRFKADGASGLVAGGAAVQVAPQAPSQALDVKDPQLKDSKLATTALTTETIVEKALIDKKAEVLGNSVVIAPRKNLKREADDTSAATHGQDLVEIELPRQIRPRSRNNILMMHGRNFSLVSKRFNQFVVNSRREADRLKRAAGAPPKASSDGRVNGNMNVESTAQEPVFDPRGDRYQVKEDRFWRETLGTDVMGMGIDTAGGFKKKARKDRETSAITPEKSGAYPAIPDNLSQRNPAPVDALGSHSTTRKANASESATRSGITPTQIKPIIIIPSTATSFVGMDNAASLFQDSKFVKRDPTKPENLMRISVKRFSPKLGRNVEYDVTNNFKSIAGHEWSNVAAVICTGQEWQFKQFPQRSAEEALKQMKGFHFRFDDEPQMQRMKELGVLSLAFGRNKRHTDITVMTSFWNELDTYIKAKMKL